MATPVDVPTDALALLDRVDYADAYSARLTSPRTARDGTQRALDAAHALLRAAHVVHRGLRLHVVRADADHPLGWSVLEETPDLLVLGADGSLLTPRIHVHIAAGSVTVATVVRYNQRRAKTIWAGVAPVHRLVLQRLVDASI